MIIEHLIHNDFVPPRFQQPLSDLIRLVNDFKLSHIPVVDKGIFKGVLSETYLTNCTEKTLTENTPCLEKIFLFPSQTIFQAINILRLYETNFIAIVSSKEKYLRYITSKDILNELSKLPAISEPGALLIVETYVRNYSMSEISKIVESNNTRIYEMGIYRFVKDRIQILLKINDSNTQNVIETFKRFQYQLIFKSFSTKKDDWLKERYHHFMKFLEL